jgi:pimeloyl-ACP methyl ester carboxylesterase
MTTIATGHSSGDLPIYYELRGMTERTGGPAPLLLIHGGGSTIESNWSNLIPELEGSRPVLAVELQGHGRTGSGDRSPGFAASADDVAVLLDERGLDLGPVDMLGFSNGGQVGMQLAVRHPDLVRRLIVASAPFRRDGMIDGFWPGLEGGTFASMPAQYVEADLAVSNDPHHARRMFELDRELMLGFTDWPDSLPAAIQAPTLVVGGDLDVITRDHLARLSSLIPGGRLLIVPGYHGSYLGEVLAAGDDLRSMRATLPFLIDFLDAP